MAQRYLVDVLRRNQATRTEYASIEVIADSKAEARKFVYENYSDGDFEWTADDNDWEETTESLDVEVACIELSDNQDDIEENEENEAPACRDCGDVEALCLDCSRCKYCCESVGECEEFREEDAVLSNPMPEPHEVSE